MKDPAKFIRNNLTNADIEKTLANRIIASDPEVAKKNDAFYELLDKELVWRDINGKIYTEEQKIADIKAHQEKIVAVYTANPEHKGYIEPDRYWWE